ncbi:MAG: hypothetical protein AAGG44_17255, partial [Planctomycetota bacterium]
ETKTGQVDQLRPALFSSQSLTPLGFPSGRIDGDLFLGLHCCVRYIAGSSHLKEATMQSQLSRSSHDRNNPSSKFPWFWRSSAQTLILVFALIYEAGCETKTPPAAKQVGTTPIEGNLTSDTQRDLGHEHRHIHGGGQLHDHEHEGFEGAHEHPHLHEHRHAPSRHGGRIVAIGHTDHLSRFRNHYHAEVPPVEDGKLNIYLSCMEMTESLQAPNQAEFAPPSFAGTLSIAKPSRRTTAPVNSTATQVQFQREAESPADCICYTTKIPPEFLLAAENETLSLMVTEISLGGEPYTFSTTLLSSSQDAQETD